MTTRAKDADRTKALHDSLFNDVAELPIDDVRRALKEAGVDVGGVHATFRSQASELAQRLKKANLAIPPALAKILTLSTDPLTSHPVPHPPQPWTNPSVLQLAGDLDPVDVVISKARSLVTTALDQDWVGPPYDPVKLAELLGFDVQPVADIPDARTVAAADRFRIEFNPNRSVGRVRYSLAHEIAHTLFPDCAAQVRNRIAHTNASPDEWQLEALCNIAAAEILMPFGSFPNVTAEVINTQRVISLQKQFKVSTEALLLRIVRLAPIPCAAFGASQIEKGRLAGRWRVDYLVASSRWELGNLRGTIGPEDTTLRECSRVGFSTSTEETWGDNTLRVEALALPPYPGAITPRVAGFFIVPGSISKPSDLVEIYGDALQPRGSGLKLIIHVVTDKAQTWGGGGFAAAVRRTWPHVHEDFASWAGEHGSNLKLGRVRFCEAEEGIRVASMVAQHGYGPARKARIRYGALVMCVGEAFRSAAGAQETVHLPPIGTGHAGGEWFVVRDILQDAATATQVNATVYRLPSSGTSPEQGVLGFRTGPESQRTDCD